MTKLGAKDWVRVFDLRCRSKRGVQLAPDEQRLIERAHREDPERYRLMSDDVFEATKPFGST